MSETFDVGPGSDIPDFEIKAPRSRARSVSKPKGETKAKPRVSKKSLKVKIGAMLQLFNMTFFFLPDAFKGDALDAAEIEALSDALDKQAQKSDFVYKTLDMVISGGDSAQLLWVVGIIAARRFARHGLIPAEIDAASGFLINMDPTMLGEMASGFSPEAADSDS